jgi:exodeoxyribonuclease VII large subunit
VTVLPDTDQGDHPDARSIADLYDDVDGALARAFPRNRPIWVRGEIQSISDQARTGHCYIDLVDPVSAGERQAPVLRVKCWRTTWGPLRHTLRGEGIELQPGLVVVLRGVLDFYRARAEIGFVMAELDVTSLLGRMAAKRSALIRKLVEEGVFEANRKLSVPAVPLRVGLVGSPGTEGFRDFVGQLTGSGLAFRIVVAPVAVQGSGAARAIARALQRIVRGGCDLAVVVRGGGSKADLAVFDAELVARAVASSPLPVWTGIGHTGDESVADMVANRAFVTPTDCGRELAHQVAGWWEESVVKGAIAVQRRAHDVLAAAEHRDAMARGRLTGAARHQLRAHSERLATRSRAVATGAQSVPETAQRAVADVSLRLGPMALDHIARSGDRVESYRRLLAAYDVGRQLERGYTLTLDPSGAVVRSAAQVSEGSDLLTRFADGSVRSQVQSVEMGGSVESDGSVGLGGSADEKSPQSPGREP